MSNAIGRVCGISCEFWQVGLVWFSSATRKYLSTLMFVFRCWVSDGDFDWLKLSFSLLITVCIFIEINCLSAFHYAQGLHGVRSNRTLNLRYNEQHVWVEFLMEWKLPSLSEGSVTSREITLKRLLTCVDIGVLLQVLWQGEAFKADAADVLLNGRMGGHVSSQGESGGVGFVTVSIQARIGSFHWFRL